MAVPRLHGNIPGSYFVTSRTWEGRRFFITEPTCLFFFETLLRYRQNGAYVLHAFVLMPDHFHVLLTPACNTTLERAVQLIKGGPARMLGLARHLQFPVWQRGFSDHRIRDARDYASHLRSVEQNPVRKRLVVDAADYRWSSATGGYKMDPFPQGLKPPEKAAWFGTAKAVPSRKTMPKRKDMKRIMIIVAMALVSAEVGAQTPTLNIKSKHSLPMEEQRKEQMERLAKQYDLKKYTITREIMIERGAMNHSYPVLTLNLRFLDNDDLALSAYVHEQGHWVLMERHRADNPALFEDLQRTFPNMEIRVPEGDGELRSSYFHIAVCMREWQAMEALVGPERSRKVIEWKQGDHYKVIYSTVLNHRDQVESVLGRYGVMW